MFERSRREPGASALERIRPQPGLRAWPRRILVVIDPAAYAQPALEKAVRIALRGAGTLEFHICDEEPQLAESWAGAARVDEYRQLRRQRLLAELARLAEPLRARGLAVDCTCEWQATLAQDIGDHALRTQPDLIVKEMHRHTDWNLARQVVAPLLLVRAKPWPAAVRIAVLPDRSDDAAVLEEAQALADALDGTLDVFDEARQAPPHWPDVLVVGEIAPADSTHATARGADCDLLVVRVVRPAAGAAAPCATERGAR